MVGHCGECGKHFEILFPDLWRYRKGKRLFCSWHCLRADEKKNESEDDYMATRMKKDGTPAKRPGPKKRTVPEVITTEAIPVKPLNLQGGVNYQVHVDETAKARRKLTGWGFNAMCHPELGEFYHDKEHNCIDWRTPAGDEVSLSVNGWAQLLRELPEVFEQLGVKA